MASETPAGAEPAQALRRLGWSSWFDERLAERLAERRAGGLQGLPARVVVEHRDRYRLLSAAGPIQAWPPQGMRRKTPSLDKPGVGDWVVVAPPDRPEDLHQICALLPRRTALTRQAAGERAEPQLVAANLDTVFVMTSMNPDFSPRRLERYLAVVQASGAAAVLLLNKADLAADPAEHQRYLDQAAAVAGDIPVLALSAQAGAGLDQLAPWLGEGQSIGLVGSSGVGKSTLLNRLHGEAAQDTAEIRDSDARGRHTTTHRELFVLSGGRGILIDTPGMRELQLWGGEDLAEVFPDVDALLGTCQFRDCRHSGEPGCAIAEAVATGELSSERWEGYRKLQAEQQAQNTRRDRSPAGRNRRRR